MAKTYAPQFVRELRRLAQYAIKHGDKMNAVLSGAEQAAVQSVITASQAFSAEKIEESP